MTVAVRVFPGLSGYEPDLVIEAASFPNLDPTSGIVSFDASTMEPVYAATESIEADARQEARRLLLSARREAETMVARARQEAHEIREKARQDGLTGGTSQAIDEARREASPVLENLTRAAKELDLFRQHVREQLDRQLPNLIVLLTKKVIQRELLLEKSTIVGIVRAALERVAGNGREVTLRLNPKDAELLATHRGDVLEGLDKIQGILFESDPSISPGGCLVETPNGLVDARLETQLEEATRILEGGSEG